MKCNSKFVLCLVLKIGIIFHVSCSESDDDLSEHTLALVETDDYSNYYLHVDTVLNQTENFIANFDYDFIIIHVMSKTYKEANKYVVRILKNALRVHKKQLIIVTGKKEAWKKIMLVDWKGTEEAIVNMLIYSCRHYDVEEEMRKRNRLVRRNKLRKEDVGSD